MKINFALATFPIFIIPALAINFNPVLSNIGPALAGLADSATSTFAGSFKDTSIEEVWEELQKLGPQAGRVVLAEVTKVYSEAAHVLEEFQDAVEQMVDQAHKIQEEIEKNNVTTVEYLTERLSHEIGELYEDLKDIINDPLPAERGERAQARARIASQIIDKFELAYIQVLAEVGVPRHEATAQFREFAPKVVNVLLIIGNIADEHPKLVEALVFVVSMTVLPRIPIFGSLLTFFGFGPLGPVKGTTAAWAQKTFFGGAVTSGSWFAMLQSAGMTGALHWLDKVIVSAGLTAIVGHIIEQKSSSGDLYFTCTATECTSNL